MSFLRGDLALRRALTCAQAGTLRDRSPVRLAGLVLVHQKPGSAKGVLFITVEDETGVANLVVWPGLFEASHRVVLGARMLGIDGQVQRDGEVVHVVARRLHDLSALLDGLGEREGSGPDYGAGEWDAGVPPPHERGDELHHAGGPDDRSGARPASAMGPTVRDIFIPDLSLEAIRMKPRDFR